MRVMIKYFYKEGEEISPFTLQPFATAFGASAAVRAVATVTITKE